MKSRGVKIAPLVLLRDPIARTISHFHFAKQLAWSEGLKIRKQNLTQYLKDPESMLETRNIWHDGQVSGAKRKGFLNILSRCNTK